MTRIRNLIFLFTAILLTGCSLPGTQQDFSRSPEDARLTAEESLTLEERARKLYSDKIGELFEAFWNESPYIFAEIGAKYPVMLVADRTIAHSDDGRLMECCISCDVYYYHDGACLKLGRLSSLGTAYPIAYDETGLYEAGSQGVRRLSIIEDDKSAPTLQVVEEAYVSSDAGGSILYSRLRSNSSHPCGDPPKQSGSSVLSKEEYTRLYDNYLSATEADFKEALRDLYDSLEIPAETLKLLQCLEDASGYKMEDYLCVDFDKDGTPDLAGTYPADGRWHIWYLSGSDLTARNLTCTQSSHCELHCLPLDDRTHLILDFYDEKGADKCFSIYELNNSILHPVISDAFGYVFLDETSTFNHTLNVNVEDYGGGYGGYTYLCYEDGSYKEYGAAAIPESQFMQYGNAQEVLQNIRTGLGSDSIRYTYFLRGNGLLHVQCEWETPEQGTQFGYFTLGVDSDQALFHTGLLQLTLNPQKQRSAKSLYHYQMGRLKDTFTDLEVIWP